MRTWIRCTIALVFALLMQPWQQSLGQASADVTPLRFPLQFTENAGQWPGELLFAALRPRQAAWLTKEGLTFRCTSDETAVDARIPVEAPVVQDQKWCSVRFVNPSPRLRVEAGEKTLTVSHFYKGNDSTTWRSDVANYRQILYRDVWKHIDVAYSEHSGTLSQEITLHLGAMASDVRLRVEGLPRDAMPQAYIVGDSGMLTKRLLAYGLEAGEMSFPSLPDAGRMPITVRIDYAEGFGGSMVDIPHGVALDDSGNIYVTGESYSLDLPVKNAYMSSQQGVSDFYLARLNCDGKAIAFCTYFGGTDQERYPGQATSGYVLHRSMLRLTPSGSLLLTGITCSRDFPIIGNVLQPAFVINDNMSVYDKNNSCLMLFAKQGIPERSTYIGGPGRTTLWDNAVDGDGNIYVLSAIWGDSLWCITPDVIVPRMKNKYGQSIALVKLKPDLSDIVYATYIAGIGGDNAQHPVPGRSFVAADSRQHVYIAGNWSYGDSSEFPLLNPKFPFTPSRRSSPSYIMKFNNAATRYIYATWCWAAEFHHMMLDSSDNLLLTGCSNGAETVVTTSFLSGPTDRYCASFTKLDSSGAIVFHDVFGAVGENAEASLIDRCGNYVVYGSGIPTSSPNPLVDGTRTQSPIQNTRNNILYVFDETGRSVVYSTDYEYYNMYIVNSGNINWSMCSPVIDGVGNHYVYARSVKWNDDAVLIRLRPPVCEPLLCTMSCIDTVVVSKRRQFVTPPSFRIEVELACSDTQGPVTMLGGALALPSNLVLVPDTQSLTTPAMSFSPGQRRSYFWTVRLDSTKVNAPYDTVSFTASYAPQRQDASCPSTATVCGRRIAIVEHDEGDPMLHCSLSLPDTLHAAPDGRSYEGNPFALGYTLTNGDLREVTIDSVRLVLPAGMSIVTEPVGDLLRPGALLAPAGSLQRSWTIRAGSLGIARNVAIAVDAFDRYGILVSHCVRTVHIEAVTSLECGLTGPARARYYPSTGMLQPDPFEVTAVLENPLDTLAGLASVRLDFSQASRLALADGEAGEKGPAWIAARFRKAFTWRLKSLAPQTSGIDTLAVRYTSMQGGREGSCSYTLPVDVLQYRLTCSLAGVDSLSPRDTAYAPNPFPVGCTMVNGGQAASPPLVVELTFAAASMQCLEPPFVTLPAIAAGDSLRHAWNLAARTSRVDRSEVLTVAVRDSAGAELTACGTPIFLPRIERDLRCSLETPDTLHYDLPADTYTPDPFTATLALANVLDTAKSAIETELDLTAAPHLTLDAGEIAGRMLDSIPAHARATLAWRLAVALRSDSAIVERVTVRYRLVSDSAAAGGGWLVCSKDVVIEGGKRIIAASCAVAGHDTLWADVAYEDVIPHPVQVQYTITNAGTVPLAACTAAIVHPPALTLVNPSDSIQDYGTIPPGTSVAREWLLVLDQSQAQPGAMQFLWNSGCLNLAGDSACTHRVTLVTGPPRGIVLSPWLLRFRAHRHAPLPASQAVTLWTGGALAMPWQLQPSASWLDVQPLAGSAKQTVAVQPNTTNLQDGSYPATIGVASSAMVAPPRVEVIYEIGMLNEAQGSPSLPQGIDLENPYPNPTRGTASIAFTTASPGTVQLALYDIYGRRVATLAEGKSLPGRQVVRADLSTLPPGVYVCVLNAGGACATRRLVLR